MQVDANRAGQHTQGPVNIVAEKAAAMIPAEYGFRSIEVWNGQDK
jgi:hypothetical protein